MTRFLGGILLLLLAGCGNEVSQATRQLQDDDPAVRKQGARWLAETTEDAAGSILELQKALSDADPEVRRLSAQALGKIGPGAKSAVPELEKLLMDSDETVRLVAAVAIVNIDSANPAPVDVLAASAKSGNPRSIVALGQMGPAAEKAVSALVAALKSNQSLIQIQTAKALEKIGPKAKDALPALNQLTRSSKEDLREAARRAKLAIQKEE